MKVTFRSTPLRSDLAVLFEHFIAGSNRQIELYFLFECVDKSTIVVHAHNSLTSCRTTVRAAAIESFDGTPTSFFIPAGVLKVIFDTKSEQGDTLTIEVDESKIHLSIGAELMPTYEFIVANYYKAFPTIKLNEGPVPQVEFTGEQLRFLTTNFLPFCSSDIADQQPAPGIFISPVTDTVVDIVAFDGATLAVVRAEVRHDLLAGKMIPKYFFSQLRQHLPNSDERVVLMFNHGTVTLQTSRFISRAPTLDHAALDYNRTFIDDRGYLIRGDDRFELLSALARLQSCSSAVEISVEDGYSGFINLKASGYLAKGIETIAITSYDGLPFKATVDIQSLVKALTWCDPDCSDDGFALSWHGHGNPLAVRTSEETFNIFVPTSRALHALQMIN